jgi:hypothetical protein
MNMFKEGDWVIIKSVPLRPDVSGKKGLIKMVLKRKGGGIDYHVQINSDFITVSKDQVEPPETSSDLYNIPIKIDVGLDGGEATINEVKPIVTLHDAIKFELVSKKLKHPTGSYAEMWAKDGKCPKCGELGRFSQCVAICSQHGEY